MFRRFFDREYPEPRDIPTNPAHANKPAPVGWAVYAAAGIGLAVIGYLAWLLL